MQATATTTMSNREPAEQTKSRALVRFNAMTFHSLVAASFLETAAPRQVNRLVQVYARYPDVRLWLEQAWWAQRAELGRLLRAHIEATWPEFDWAGAYEGFCETYRPRSGVEGCASRCALETLALCVTTSQAALFYRALAGGADDPALRALVRRAAQEHAGHFDYLQALFERMKRHEGVGFAESWRAVTAICRNARDGAVAAAFHPLADNWKGAAIVPGLTYPEFRERMGRLIQHHVGLGWLERLLFRPWVQRASGQPAPAVPASVTLATPYRMVPA
jgi:hypothetical protein